jgi:hypothetical protein
VPDRKALDSIDSKSSFVAMARDLSKSRARARAGWGPPDRRERAAGGQTLPRPRQTLPGQDSFPPTEKIEQSFVRRR